MSETPAAPRLAESIAEVEDALLSRWPETRLEPSLDRIRAFTELLGEPQHAYRVVHLTGTNGKTSTSRMVDALLRALELRTGRFTSPHLETINERISVDGDPLDDEAFVRAFNDVAPYTHLVDEDQPHPLSFFETVVGMAYAAFADAPVDVAVVEVGMGGGWDATNVADGVVAVVTPVAMDHAQYLGGSLDLIAAEKAGIVKAGAT
ncbi:MAG: bifunctional folylpolyglutamate synthase/dihydrofolate synthase, partial [Nocardioides sp.]